MELRRFVTLLRQRMLLIALILLASLAAGYTATPRTALYRSQVILFTGVSVPNAGALFNATAQYGQQLLASTFAAMIPSESVAQSALQASGEARSAAQVASETKASVIPGTDLIRLTVTDVNPVVAQHLANAIAAQFVALMYKIDPVSQTLTGSGPLVSPISITQPASFPVVPLSNGLTRNLTLSGIFGLVVAIGLVLLLDYLDISVRTPEDLERQLGLPVLGAIPYVERPPVPGRALVPTERVRSL